MGYRHVLSTTDHSDLAGGFVLRSAPGFPAFPVRLASEVLLRCRALRGGPDPVVVWDPCCGSGYLAAVLALRHRPAIRALVASDIAADALRLARTNLALLDPDALEARAIELDATAERFGRPSYRQAAAAARRLGVGLAADGGAVPATVGRADVFDRDALAAVVRGQTPDIVIADVPYGEQTAWHPSSRSEGAPGVPGMLAVLGSVLPASAVVAVVVRGRRVPLDGWRAAERFRVGTRAAALFTADGLGAVHG